MPPSFLPVDRMLSSIAGPLAFRRLSRLSSGHLPRLECSQPEVTSPQHPTRVCSVSLLIARASRKECSTSGRPPSSPGTEPAPWTSKARIHLQGLVASHTLNPHPSSMQVIYHQGSAFDPSTYSHLLASSTAVVHTLGILLESDYKGAVRSGSAGGVLSSLMAAGRFLGSNPLEKRQESSDRMSIKPTYESMNRDSGTMGTFPCFPADRY
jgi:hypothetical protein